MILTAYFRLLAWGVSRRIPCCPRTSPKYQARCSSVQESRAREAIFQSGTHPQLCGMMCPAETPGLYGSPVLFRSYPVSLPH